MGLLSGLSMLPFTPVRGVAWVAGRVAEAAIQEIHSPAALRARLRDLALRLESGMISESEFDQEEDEILRRLSMAGLAGRDARL